MPPSGGGGLGGASLYKSNGDVEAKTQKATLRIKRIGAKTFYWKENAWQDAEIGTLDSKTETSDVIKIDQFSDAYFKLSSLDEGRWALYLVNSEPTIVRIKGKTYRIQPAGK